MQEELKKAAEEVEMLRGAMGHLHKVEGQLRGAYDAEQERLQKKMHQVALTVMRDVLQKWSFVLARQAVEKWMQGAQVEQWRRQEHRFADAQERQTGTEEEIREQLGQAEQEVIRLRARVGHLEMVEGELQDARCSAMKAVEGAHDARQKSVAETSAIELASQQALEKFTAAMAMQAGEHASERWGLQKRLHVASLTIIRRAMDKCIGHAAAAVVSEWWRAVVRSNSLQKETELKAQAFLEQSVEVAERLSHEI